MISLAAVREVVDDRLGSLEGLPSRIYRDGYDPDPRGRESFLRVEVVGGPTTRRTMSYDGLVEQRPLLVVDAAILFGSGDAELVGIEDRIRAGFRAGTALGNGVRVRSNGPYTQPRRREGRYLVSATSVPLSVLR